MYLFYIDESGNTGPNLDSVDQPIHWLVAVGVRGSSISVVERDMQDIAYDVFDFESLSPEFELHGAEIFNGKGHCRGMPPAERVDLHRRIIGLVRKHDLHVFVLGIHKRRHRDRAARRGYYQPEHPHRLGFMWLVESIDGWLERQQPEGDDQAPLHGLLVTDVHSMNRELIKSFPRWRTWRTEFGYRAREIRYLVDTIHTVPSHDSWLIQMADCVAFLRNRFERVGDRYGWVLADPDNMDLASRAVWDLYREGCRPQLAEDRVWPPW